MPGAARSGSKPLLSIQRRSRAGLPFQKKRSLLRSWFLITARNWIIAASAGFLSRSSTRGRPTKARDWGCLLLTASCSSTEALSMSSVNTERGLPFRSFSRWRIMRSPKKHARAQRRLKEGASAYSLSMMKNRCAKFMKADLKSLGYTVYTAQDGEEALVVYQHHQSEMRFDRKRFDDAENERQALPRHPPPCTLYSRATSIRFHKFGGTILHHRQ